jgi:23S rRNA (cytosine1962-C5)-methyltransferase
MTVRPIVKLLPGRQRRAQAGHPWIFSNEVAIDANARALQPGEVVAVEAGSGEPLGAAFYNPHSLIALRLLGLSAAAPIDAGFLADRLARALALREALYDRPFYRLVHAEADRLPGLICDRYGDALVLQVNAAGMERLLDPLLEALDRVLKPKAVLLRNDGAGRALEQVESYVRVAKGGFDGPVELEENGLAFFADPAGGQKTGWFYDQRDNRRFMARLARGRRVVDLYAYAGGFAVAAAKAGASAVTAVDSSEPSLALAEAAARRNGVEIRFVRARVFDEAERLAAAGERFGVVIADPPAFAKSRKDVPTALRGYRKLAKLCARLVEPQGFLFLASCSHAVEPERFAEECRKGLGEARRTGRLIRSAGAAPDHPVHPQLPETAYLKALVYQLD